MRKLCAHTWFAIAVPVGGAKPAGRPAHNPMHAYEYAKPVAPSKQTTTDIKGKYSNFLVLCS